MAGDEIQEEDFIFSCRLDSSKILADVLHGLIDRNQKDQVCYFEASEERTYHWHIFSPFF